MPFVKDIPNKKFNKKRIRAWNVLDVIDSSDLTQGNDQTSGKDVKQNSDLVNNLLDVKDINQDTNKVYTLENKQVNNEANKEDNKQNDQVVFEKINNQVTNQALGTKYDLVNNSKYGKFASQRNNQSETSYLEGDGLTKEEVLVDNQVNNKLKIIEICYNSLQGAQKAILKKIIFLSDKEGKTGVLQQRDFEQFTISTFKTNVVRLIKKGLIKRGAIQKKGRGGYFSFELSKELLEILKFN